MSVNLAVAGFAETVKGVSGSAVTRIFFPLILDYEELSIEVVQKLRALQADGFSAATVVKFFENERRHYDPAEIALLEVGYSLSVIRAALRSNLSTVDIFAARVLEAHYARACREAQWCLIEKNMGLHNV